MKTLFKVEKLKFDSIQELPNSWNCQNYLDLMEVMEFGDTSEIAPEELKEYCLMTLADNEPEDAAKIVLKYVFRDKLTIGQINNLSNEMLDEKIWEEYADISMHEDFFNVNQLLYQAYNGKFPNPKAVMLQVKVFANSKEDMSVFNTFPEASLIRLLVRGLSENTLIYRLFEEMVEGLQFRDAKDIIWQLTTEKKGDKELVFSIISSSYWLHDFKFVTTFEAATHADEV